mgnify:FL=1
MARIDEDGDLCVNGRDVDCLNDRSRYICGTGCAACCEMGDGVVRLGCIGMDWAEVDGRDVLRPIGGDKPAEQGRAVFAGPEYQGSGVSGGFLAKVRELLYIDEEITGAELEAEIVKNLDDGFSIGDRLIRSKVEDARGLAFDGWSSGHKMVNVICEEHKRARREIQRCHDALAAVPDNKDADKPTAAEWNAGL